MTDDIRYFGPRPAHVETEQKPGQEPGDEPIPKPAPVSAPVGIVSVPEEVLLRHNARVLDPRTATALPGYPPPTPTIYRATDLLMPMDRRADMSRFNEVLNEKAGMVITDKTNDNRFFARGELTASNPRKPAVVDAWRALQKLRSEFTEDEVAGIGLNHLLIGTAMGGLGGASGVLQGVPGAVNGGPYGGSSGDDLGYWRQPVMLEMPRPPRRTDTEVRDEGLRRPVIAVLDTGVAKNAWLDAPLPDTSPFVTFDQALQDDIDANSLPGEAPGGSYDEPYTAEPLVGALSTHAGHATFIMGLIQQVAPDATVLSIRVMHNDGIASSGTISYALKQLAERVDAAQREEDPEVDKMVDIVSLSLGNYLEGDFGTAELDELTKAIDGLRERGVIVVASAGNFASSREFYPAALAKRTTEDPVKNGAPPVISVGALNPNLTKSLFSNDSEEWVTCWARGASLISTFPESANAARSAAYRVEKRLSWPRGLPENDPIHFRESMESDDYLGGFAMWSGTSFATPLVAGKLAKLLFDDKENTSFDVGDTIERANRVIKQLGGENT
ncbi:S8 family peptidase [Lentzea nigeriaca]|uniref:S8 family peptidase n=1 Tax=Lentzea nigeriaca TaxID=1128665 RepID=UPI00195D1F94|nr:S8/S53 family peptidase [Lentzea nigeriaca]MBM7856808.1 subtilisin family serine protease [Lentzea nigeriaca]